MGKGRSPDLYVARCNQSLISPGWDMSHPAAAQALADLGVDIIFAPTYWLATDSEP
jgi:predicted amidohydrolase